MKSVLIGAAAFAVSAEVNRPSRRLLTSLLKSQLYLTNLTFSFIGLYHLRQSCLPQIRKNYLQIIDSITPSSVKNRQ